MVDSLVERASLLGTAPSMQGGTPAKPPVTRALAFVQEQAPATPESRLRERQLRGRPECCNQARVAAGAFRSDCVVGSACGSATGCGF
jgi:hypothetical protein